MQEEIIKEERCLEMQVNNKDAFSAKVLNKAKKKEEETEKGAMKYALFELIKIKQAVDFFKAREAVVSGSNLN